MRSNFLLGSLIVDDAVKTKLKRTPLDLVARHAVNDHGLATVRELRSNQHAMQTADAIVSRYLVDPTDPSQGFVEVITSESWATTTVKLKDEKCFSSSKSSA
jgi:hypothetical protein